MIKTLEDMMHMLGHMTTELNIIKVDKTFIKHLENAGMSIQYALEWYMNNKLPKK